MLNTACTGSSIISRNCCYKINRFLLIVFCNVITKIFVKSELKTASSTGSSITLVGAMSRNFCLKK